MAKLRNAICGKNNQNLDDLPHMTGKCVRIIIYCSHFLLSSEFQQTGDVESLNSLQLKYANKTYSYRSVSGI